MRQRGVARLLLNASLYPEMATSAMPGEGARGVTLVVANAAAAAAPVAAAAAAGGAAGEGAAPASAGAGAGGGGGGEAAVLRTYALRFKKDALVAEFRAAVDKWRVLVVVGKDEAKGDECV
jgi:hypothetical protein